MRPIPIAAALLLASAGLAAASSGVEAYPYPPAPIVPAAPAAASRAIAPKHGKPVTTPGLVEPHLHLARLSPSPGDGFSPRLRVALTFDACGGRTDGRILAVLTENRIPATIFATARWLRHNPETVALMKTNPDLFEVENHGARHVPAVDRPAMVYGITAAGSPAAVAAEVNGGARAIEDAGFARPHWFRGATARYDAGALSEISGLGFDVAGFSLNGDDGASVAAATAERRLASARDGSVIIAHINQPDRAAGAGVARGILALEARGATFLRLSDVAEEPLSAALR